MPSMLLPELFSTRPEMWKSADGVPYAHSIGGQPYLDAHPVKEIPIRERKNPMQ